MKPDDLFANMGEFLYLRLGSTYYKRVTGKGWTVIPEADANAAVTKWDKLHPGQYQAYYPVLQEQGLVG